MGRKPSSGRASDFSFREKAYLHIQRKIISGELQAGGAVSELALAKELGSSRTPIREALGQLVAEGLLEQTPNRGAAVVQLNRQDIIDLFELREALEVYAIGKAARRQVKEQDLERLQKLADEILVFKRELEESGSSSLSIVQMYRLMNVDLAFHALLMRLAANARILKVVNETRLLIRIFAMRHRGHEAAELDWLHNRHCDLLRAVTCGDPECAQRLMREHIQTSQRERLEEFDRWEREDSLKESVPAFFHWPAPVE